jgi:integrase
MMVYRRKGKTVYSIKLPLRDGGWIERSTGTKDRLLARDMAAMITTLGPHKLRAWDVLEPVTGGAITLATLHDLWVELRGDLASVRARLDDVDLEPLVATWAKELRNPARGIKPDTADHYVSAVRLLVRDGVPFRRSTLTQARCEEWLAEMTCAPGTIRKRAAGLSDWCGWLVSRGKLPRNPMRDVALPAPGKPRDRWLTTAQVVILADAKPEPYRTLDYLLAGTASDLTTALGLTRADVDLPAMTVRLRGTKAHTRDRVAVVASFAHAALRAACTGLLPTARLFAAIPNRWDAADVHRETCAALADQHPWVVGYWLKDHRHTWAVRMAKSGAPMRLISEGLGHANEQLATQVYARYLPTSDERAKWETIAAAQDSAAAKQAGSQSP